MERLLSVAKGKLHILNSSKRKSELMTLMHFNNRIQKIINPQIITQ